MSAPLASLLHRHSLLIGRRNGRAAHPDDLAKEQDHGATGADREPAVWFEVEDFLRYFDHFRNPTGLQRLPLEIYLEADRLYGHTGRVRFCRLSAYSKQLRAISLDTIVAAYANPPGAAAPWRTIWEPEQFWRALPRLPPVLFRHPRFFFSIFKVAARDVVDRLAGRHRFERDVRRDDIIVSLGAAWGVPGYMKHMAAAKRRYGIKLAIMIHDLIPIEYPCFVERRHAVRFRNWLHEAIPIADMVLTTSKHSRDALIRLAADAGWSLPRIEVAAPGSGLNDRLSATEQTTISLPQRYVLFVSTIEARKNHRLLVKVWRRLLERHGADAVPTLIFAGQIGWLVDDLLAELAASDYLRGKIVLMPKLSDAELRQAYRSALFTVFPSLCEGWGLPVAESLTHGKFCVAANSTSIPEVGGDLVDYFDPTKDDDALTKIERLLLDPGYLAAREARLRAEYRPRTWTDCVEALIGTIDEATPVESRSSAAAGQAAEKENTVPGRRPATGSASPSHA
jgi:glycosyltransferase involved in cell wall biosynthesis